MTTTKTSNGARAAIGDIAPKLAEITDDVLFGDVWERPELSKRDRSLVTCAALVATGKTEQMTFHLPRAIENGVTRAELIEGLSDQVARGMACIESSMKLFGMQLCPSLSSTGPDNKPGERSE